MPETALICILLPHLGQIIYQENESLQLKELLGAEGSLFAIIH